MKIGFVLDDTLDSTDGVQQYILTVGAWLTTQGHEVHYLVGETLRSDIPHIHSLSRNFKVRFNGNRMSVPLPASPSSSTNIRALLARERFDVLHIQVPYSPLLAHKIILNAPRRTAVVGTFHIVPHSALVKYATLLLAAVSRRSARRFDAMLSVSVAAQRFVKQTYGLDSVVLPNVVDMAPYAVAKPFLLPGEGTVIMFLGRLVPRKGCMVLLQAVQQLVAGHPDQKLRVVICGRGPLLPELEAFIAEHRLKDTVQFAGYLSEADKPRYLKAADIAVFPSLGGESFGIVLLEAMAAGRPVVLAADNPGYVSVLEAYPDILTPAGDAAALASRLQKYLTDDRAKAAALAWQRTFVPQFDVNVVGQKLLEIYDAAIAPRSAAHTLTTPKSD